MKSILLVIISALLLISASVPTARRQASMAGVTTWKPQVNTLGWLKKKSYMPEVVDTAVSEHADSVLDSLALVISRRLDRMITSLDPSDAKASVSKIVLGNLSIDHWCYPLVGSYVTSPYNKLREKDDSTFYHHTGVDIKTRINHDSIHAAFDGVVVASGVRSGYGNCITIRHAYGFETLYAHESKLLVHVGQRVHAGDVIGLTGMTGHATGDHLHFELFYRGQRYDPSMIFDHRRHTLQPAVLYLSGRLVERPYSHSV